MTMLNINHNFIPKAKKVVQTKDKCLISSDFETVKKKM